MITGEKRGFEIPLVSWLKNELREILMDTIGSKSAKVRGYLEGRFVDELLPGKVMADRNWGYVSYALLVLELWLRQLESTGERAALPAPIASVGHQ